MKVGRFEISKCRRPFCYGFLVHIGLFYFHLGISNYLFKDNKWHIWFNHGHNRDEFQKVSNNFEVH
jgi:hypothetical protein